MGTARLLIEQKFSRSLGKVISTPTVSAHGTHKFGLEFACHIHNNPPWTASQNALRRTCLLACFRSDRHNHMPIWKGWFALARELTFVQCGHIEDVVIDPKYQGLKLGQRYSSSALAFWQLITLLESVDVVYLTRLQIHVLESANHHQLEHWGKFEDFNEDR